MTIAVLDGVVQSLKSRYATEPLNPNDAQTSTATNKGTHFNNFSEYFQSDLYRDKQRQIDAKIKKVLDYGYDQEIRRRTIPEHREVRRGDYSHVDAEFREATITSEALKKGNLIARRAGEIADVPLEIYIYSLDDICHTNKRAVRDLYIAKDQDVTKGTCDVSPYGAILSEFAIRDDLKKRVVGWSHSHGGLNPFFSPPDKNNIINHVLGVCGLKRRIQVSQHWMGGTVTTAEYDIRYVPAIVFNARGAQPFVAVAVEYTRRYDGQKVVHINENGQLRVIEETNGIDTNQVSIDSQILKRVRYNGRTLGEIIGVTYTPQPGIEPQTPVQAPTPKLEELLSQYKQRIESLESEKRVLERRKRRLEQMVGIMRPIYKAIPHWIRNRIYKRDSTYKQTKKLVTLKANQ